MRTSVSVLVLACIVAACGGRAHDEPDAFHWQAQVEPGSTLHLSTVTGRIDVAPAPDRQLRVTGSTHSVGRNPIHFASRQDGDEVYVCALWRSRGSCSDNGDSFGSGHSWLDMFSLFKHRSTGGAASIKVELPPGVSVEAHTTNGQISLVGTRGGVKARTLNGSINIQNAAGPIDARATNASIDVSLDSLGPEDEITLKTINGSTTVIAPAGVEGDVRLRTVNGSVRSDFPITAEGRSSSHELRGQIGQSSREITIETVNGNVSLLKANGASKRAEAQAVELRPRS
jgi:putative adhesin